MAPQRKTRPRRRTTTVMVALAAVLLLGACQARRHSVTLRKRGPGDGCPDSGPDVGAERRAHRGADRRAHRGPHHWPGPVRRPAAPWSLPARPSLHRFFPRA